MFENKYLPKAGRFLISEPFMNDPNFRRTVVLIVEKDEGGTLGFVMNRPLEVKIHEVMEGVSVFDAPIFLGGPVGHNTFHFVHRLGDKIPDGVEIAENVFWGGNFESLKACLNQGLIEEKDILFFIGYSGWGLNQLEKEMEQKSWIVAPENPHLLFVHEAEHLWQDLLKSMEEYKHLANFPIHPRMN